MVFSGSAHLQYSFGFSPESHLGKLYPDVYQGVGIGGYTFLNHAEIGSPVALYLFQRAQIAQLSKALSLDYEWNLGLAFGWHPNMCIASRTNAYINVGLLLEWNINPHWTFSIGPEYTHFSNGDTMFPNGGANTMGLRAGITADISGRHTYARRDYIRDYESELRSKSFKDRVTYDILAYGAWRADRVTEGSKLYIVNERFPIAGMHFNPLYHFSRNFSAGPSLDLVYDSSANLYGHTFAEDGETITGYIAPSFKDQIAAGLSLRGELTMSMFSVNIGSGINFIKSGEDMKRFYTLFNLKTFVSERLFLLIGYRFSSLQYTHNLMFGIGCRI
ncbi:MAG: acyloxyacyl hydrolase [Bacteroidales bacterium]|nr:acyloxyacyl hydrolase [Bacteroidales bacterium]